jgi:lysozyme
MGLQWTWCLVDESTNNLMTGWQEVEGKWYYLNTNGTLFTGWLQDKGKWYYLLKESRPDEGKYKGEMLCSCSQTIDGKDYTFNSNGELEESLVSDAIVDVIKYYEGFSATPYYDEVGVKTLGYGMTGEEIEGIASVTEEEATQMLKDWIDKKYAPVIKADLDNKGIGLTQNQFDALVCMAYNVGTGGVLGSTLYKNICAGVRDSDTILANFTAWSKAGGRTLLGLYRRRRTEANIFLTGNYSIVTD